jgi:hypothetical protein
VAGSWGPIHLQFLEVHLSVLFLYLDFVDGGDNYPLCLGVIVALFKKLSRDAGPQLGVVGVVLFVDGSWGPFEPVEDLD